MKELQYFISVDWGTSQLRMAWVHQQTGEILAQGANEQGVWASYQAWKHNAHLDRTTFFFRILESAKETLLPGVPSSLPWVISGMASASIGIQELSYAPCPFALTGTGMVFQTFQERIFLLSGVQFGGELMRGEEVQCMGLDVLLEEDAYQVILPGTHSKHIQIENGLIQSFQTFMTGELYGLLAKQSILADSVQHPDSLERDLAAFQAGVMAAQQQGLSASLFSVRSGQLLGKRGRGESGAYLSGILIGAELKGLQAGNLVLAGKGILSEWYARAIHTLFPEIKVNHLSAETYDQLVIKGQQVFLGSGK